jgi:hypothetical protein
MALIGSACDPDHGHMFIRSFVDLSMPYQEAEDALLASPEAWIPGLVEQADGEGEELLAQVGFGGLVRIERRVEVTFGTPLLFPSRLVLPISWKAASGQGLFPELEADLELGPIGPSRTQLSINATYRPPLGLVGRTVDRAMLHRVAEATLKDFIERVAERIRTPLRASA